MTSLALFYSFMIILSVTSHQHGFGYTVYLICKQLAIVVRTVTVWHDHDSTCMFV